ncbi:MAG TPA: glutamine synthetase III [bacterium]|nr:glutamine synthetase III [bacterium]HQI49063.1 glutamine synthetase III [bacterium]HQJ63485.1 glutamine synthetase III [bacterium]
MAAESPSTIRKAILIQVGSNHRIEYLPGEPAAHYYGSNSFNDKVMRERLPKEVYKKLRATIRNGVKLDMTIADAVAHAMKEWALSKGVTHFTHWFQPQTGSTAEKHDAFIEVEEDGSVIERFRGEQLVQGEPDASSFPSGGMRSTFEARGYTMWDPSSPAFIMEGPRGGILCIPSVFISYTGEALDKKTPLLRSMESINRSALRLLKLFGNHSVQRVITTIGTEQEYFLIDKGFFNLRPDLRITGRTLIGARPPKGQQLEDHYFGAIKERILGFMQDAEMELYKVGVPAKTRHNEVAPHQFEIAPIYAEANVGADRNHLIMEILRRVANRHGLALLLHEKPFAGINGSGKHNNWSMSDSDGNNLLEPGKTPEANLQFLVFLVAVVRAVYYFGDLLRASIASAGNDHRLGANEAPPAIMSVFLGDQLTAILDAIKAGKAAKATNESIIDLGIGQLPKVLRDYTDRNRTSPFAFTGNKFEFRAIGSSASVSLANTVLNAAVADSLDILVAGIEKELGKGIDLKAASLTVLRKHIKETELIRFNGNNYSKEWEQEAARRNLPNIKNTAYALDALVASKNIEMLVRQRAFTQPELEARYQTKLEQYIKQLQIEAETLLNMVSVLVVPAAISFQQRLIATVKGMKELEPLLGDLSFSTEVELLRKVTQLIDQIGMKRKELGVALAKSEGLEDLSKCAKFMADHLRPIMEELRKPVDELELLTDDEVWPLPRYSEMLFLV